VSGEIVSSLSLPAAPAAKCAVHKSHEFTAH